MITHRTRDCLGSTGTALLPLILLVGAALAGVRPAGAQDGGSAYRSEIIWHEATALFPVRVVVPDDFDSTKTYPAVIALHGAGGSSERFGRIGRAFARAGFIAAMPEGPYPVPYVSADTARYSSWELSTWLPLVGAGPALTDDPAIEARSSRITVLEYFPSVIARLEERYRIGPVYFFGFSLGGVYALAGGFYNRDRVDGIVAFGVGGFDREWFEREGDRLEDGSDLPIRLVVGRSDRLVPFSEGERARDELRAAGYEVVLDEFPGGHTVPDDALKRAVAWVRLLADER